MTADPKPEDAKPERIRHKRHSAFFRWRMRRRIRGVLKSGAPEFARFRESLSGDLPSPGSDGVILAACNDYYYWHFAVTLVLSMERQNAKQRLHLHLCEPHALTLDHIAKLQARLTCVELSWTADPCLLAEGLRYRTVYYASSRFLIAPLILEQTGAPLLAIDVDGIAAKPVWPAFEAVRHDSDVALIQRPDEEKPTMKILASAVGFNQTERGTGFARDLGQSLAALLAMRPGYHVDQIAIHYLMTEPKYRDLRIAPVPQTLWDHDFDPDAVIWTAKGWSRKESGTFQRAKQEVDAAFPDLAYRAER
ncbi:hypothetical protein NGM99_14330 [Mesorhizobium sp. RP14(2022)]|uniref:Glycosyl transferase n=1 Tax=Mesorhizobium liriopis TaxID=2953882 RepID=A0ABT1C7Z6_9HYPH|nr:hypothetical protein [Mesorhizobium liriopis]MCO6050957.1 hypothetical protein [Mesorhizobium liriopis]